ncbi:MAG: rhodanese-like domain-containing protein [Terracidiphilus sp.]|jgi:rhodanese-related sulfurtransferase
MAIALTTICVAILIATYLLNQAGCRRAMERHTITPDELHALLASESDVLVFDVRQPLDVLGDSVIIPGAKRVDPQKLLDDPSLIPAREQVIVYCTCPSEKTSRAVLHRALAMGYSQIKFLKGGLDAWRANGYSVEPYNEPFRLAPNQNKHLGVAS